MAHSNNPFIVRDQRMADLGIDPIWVSPSGRKFYPIAGGAPDGDEGGAGGGAGAGAGAGDGGQGGQGGGQQNDPGFPANTRVEDMNPAQQAAYHRTQSTKWQGRAQNNYGILEKLGVKSAEEADALLAKVTRHDELEQELMSDKDKAAADAAKTAAAQANEKYQPQLVRAKLETVAARKFGDTLTDEELDTILEPLDMRKFLTSSGDVDTAKVTAYVDGLTPAKGTSRTRQAGPTVNGLGHKPVRQNGPGEQGKAMAEKRFGKPTTA